MNLWSQICDLDYQVLKCFGKHLHLVYSPDKLVQRRFKTLKFLHREIGFLKSELLEMHPCYWRGIYKRLKYFKKKLSSVELFFSFIL